MTIKTYARRDSVTSILRKRGIPSVQYNDWIIKNDDGTFSIREQAESPTPPWDEEPKTAETTVKGHKIPDASKKAKVQDEPKEIRRTVSSAAREHILAGHDNKKVWELLKEEFDLDDSKKHYPSWYRSEMKRKAVN